ncbi:MAG TPA: STAS domain-containing protein [Terriglobales bacterium]|nr:STAS domain-containing protein [Terriglobales bacterium]
MELSVHPLGDTIGVHVSGRLDNNWSGLFAQNLDQIVADGARDLRMDLADVNYISSAGIGVLVRCYNQLRSIGGSFVVVRMSRRVTDVLRQVNLVPVLCAESTLAVPVSAVVPRRVETEVADYEIYDVASVANLQCRLYGETDPLFASAFSSRQCRPLAPCRFALGLGALGSDFDDCHDRFGEFIAVGHGAAYQPTEAASAPDYLICTHEDRPEVQVLYGISCEGDFGHLLRFEARRNRGPLPLAELVRYVVSLNQDRLVGMVMIAEVAGIVGAALRQSPVNAGANRFRYPEIGDWLSFTPERAFNRTVAIVAGVACAQECSKLEPMLRALSSDSDLFGHFHAAVFSYRPMQRGHLSLNEAISHVFETQTLLAVAHLLNDTRPMMGAGQSEFERGACWVSPISDVGGDAL